MPAARTCTISRATNRSRQPISSATADRRGRSSKIRWRAANCTSIEARYTGKVDGKDVDAFPIQITRADVERGQQRFNIYCSPCHGRLGNGHGMIVARGLRQPPSYLDQRLVDAPVGHFFDVMTNGYGAMYSYASRVAVDDRWRIAAYIRALQLSQGATATAAAGGSK